MTTAALKAFLTAFNAHDLDAIMEFFADDCELCMPRGTEAWGTRYVGKSAVREGLATRFSGIPHVHYGDDSHWVTGNLGVSTWLLTGTTKTGEAIRVRGVDLLEFRDDKIIKKVGRRVVTCLFVFTPRREEMHHPMKDLPLVGDCGDNFRRRLVERGSMISRRCLTSDSSWRRGRPRK